MKTNQTITLGLTETVTKLGYPNYQALYLDWYNSYLTISGFASHHNITWATAFKLICNARALYQKDFD